MSALRTIVVVGGDALALQICDDLRANGHAVTLVWRPASAIAERAERCGARYLACAPAEPESLRAAGVETADAVMAVDGDDRINLDVALQTRALAPGVRLVVAQFNRRLAQKLEQNMPNCTVISIAAHSAATYAAAAIDRAFFSALQLSEPDGALYGFARRRAADLDIGGDSVEEAERKLRARILAVDDALAGDARARIDASAEVVTFGAVADAARANGGRRSRRRRRASLAAFVAELDPFVRTLLLSALAFLVLASVYFGLALHLDPITALYFVVETVTTTGYGDIALAGTSAMTKGVAIASMLAGVIIANLLIAFVAAAIVRTNAVTLAGLRAVSAEDHIVVCGAGRVGTRVIDYLAEIGVPTVVIEREPPAALVRLARRGRIQLLTGDASDDETLDLCDLGRARSIVALTDNDTTNLEIGLGARARNPTIPVIARLADQRLAAAIGAQFSIRLAFSASSLAAPAFAGLAVHEGARGRCAIAGVEYAIEKQPPGDIPPGTIPLCTERGGAVLLERAPPLEPGDAVVTLRPIGRAANPRTSR